MDPLKEFFESRQTIVWIETQNTVAFLRPVPDIVIWTPCPTARPAESLRLRKVGFAPSELLGQELVVSDVNGAAHVLLEFLAVGRRNADATNVADLAIGSHNALGGVERGALRHEAVDQIRHGLAVLWMD